MSNFTDIATIREHFLDSWGDLTPVILPGVDDAQDEIDTAYVVLNVMPGDETRLTLSLNPDYEAKGIVWCDVYSPLKDNDSAAWTLADRIADIFRDWRSSDGRIRCETPSFRQGEDDGDHLRLIITLTYLARH